jgi:predicted site-specific integrase-resolvase
MSLERYITLQEATQRYKLGTQLLTRFVTDGRIRGGRLNGTFVLSEKDTQQVAEQQATREELRKKVAHLEGKRIGINEAADKYELNNASISNWARAGYIRVLSRGQGRGYKTLVDESDVAYAKEIWKLRQAGQGKKVFTREYIPNWF